MKQRPNPRLPTQVSHLLRGLQRWRRSRRGRARIPDALWRRAAQAAAKYGVHRTARALHLDYYSLADRVRPLRVGRPRRRVPHFMEIAALGTAPSAACVVEFVGKGGVLVKLHLTCAVTRSQLPSS